MKIVLVIACTLVGVFIAFQVYTVMATEKSETQAYKVVKIEKDFEIRHYPSVTMAMITSSAKTYRELGSYGFRKLAGYIFGGNKDKKQIAMTAPVHMDIGNTTSSISFVMPSIYNENNLPSPNDSSVVIKTMSEEYVAAIKFGGFASNEDIKKHTKILESSLIKSNVKYFGNFRFLAYNAPYQLFGRRNEIIVAINWQPS